MAQHTNLAPVSDQKRILMLDILRGFAVIGIFVVNIQVMSCHFVHRGACKALHTTGLDEAVSMMIKLLFINKFLSIFSFLFGLGIAMQIYRQLQKNRFGYPFFMRRMAGLFLIGVLHILFFWSGDILHIYAVLGLVLIVLIPRSNTLLIGAGAVVLVFPFYHQLLGFISGLLHFGVIPDIKKFGHEYLMAVNLNGSYTDLIKLHISEYLHNLQGIHTGLIPRAFFMFTLGAFIVKKGALTDPGQFAYRVRKPMLFAFLASAGFLVSLYYLILPNMHLLDVPSLVMVKKITARVNNLLYSVSNMTIAVFYIWLLAYSMRDEILTRMLSPLQYIGRMALTNYLMHSVFALFLFSSLGFRLYGTMRPSSGIVIVVAVSVFQIVFSKIWLHYFRYGPMEWAWRCFSYNRYLPLRKPAAFETKLILHG